LTSLWAPVRFAGVLSRPSLRSTSASWLGRGLLLAATVFGLGLMVVAPAGAQQPEAIALTSPKQDSFTPRRSVTFTWTVPQTTTGQVLYLAYTPTASGPASPRLWRPDPTVRSLTVSGLKPGYYEATIGAAYTLPADCSVSGDEGLPPVWCLSPARFGGCQAEMLDALGFDGRGGAVGDCGATVRFTVINPITVALARSYMPRVVALWDEAPRGMRSRSRCRTVNVLVARCTLTGSAHGWRVRASGLVFHQFNPSMRNVGYRLSVSMRYGNTSGRVRTRLLAPSEGWVCRLMAIPFREKGDPPDPSC